jgi:xanthine dehydrogenase YagT iron-sulfur-binding subunit
VDDLPESKKKKSASEHSSPKPSSPSVPDSSSRSSDEHGVSRRDFLKISGVSAAVPLIAGAGVLAAEAQEAAVEGPGKIPVTLNINGKRYNAHLEPRVTLLDALRDSFDLTGAKRVCDRGTCGACTVLLDGKTVYSCSVFAFDAQSHAITTVEGLGDPANLHPIQAAFVENDAQQCGFCTPGFVMASKALLDKHPKPTADEIKRGLGGNFCRCGTYGGMHDAVMQASKALAAKGGKGA